MVRNKTEWRTITVSENIYNRIESDRKDFEKTIKGGKWSMNDALVERQKILDIVESEKLLGIRTKVSDCCAVEQEKSLTHCPNCNDPCKWINI